MNLGRYTEREVRYLVEWYAENTYRRKYDINHAKLMDIDRALSLLRTLQPKAYAAVLLVGLLGIDVRTAGMLTGTARSTMQRRYTHALTTMTTYLNVGRKN
jgi:DNA-directed RNA polymerase specialized sigma24 family protein